jgi:ABC-type enterobactin transport system permease subunit
MPAGFRVFLVVGGLALIAAGPLFLIARRQGKSDTMRNFLIGAGVIALVCGTMEYVSERQVAQCLAAGNNDCYDAGTIGLQLLFVGGYAVSAWISAYSLYRS